jgi:hypothetical protein
MTGKRRKFGSGEPRRLQYRQFSRGQLALIWAASAIFILLVFLLADSNPVNWLQGVVTAIAGATALLAITAWRMRESTEQRGPDDHLKP